MRTCISHPVTEMQRLVELRASMHAMLTCRRIPTLSTGKDAAGHRRSVGKDDAGEQREVVEVGGLSTERFEACVMQSGGVRHAVEPSEPRGH